jgi:hypothetical protein
LVFNVCIQIHYLVREVWKAAKTIHKGVDDMEHIVAKITINLCCVGLQEVGESEHFEVALAEDEITYRESVGDNVHSKVS